jgi:hypothetical protein
MAEAKLLAIYLNDHLAGATLGVELTKRSLRANRGNEFGSFLEAFLVEVEEDKRSLEALMAELGVRRSRFKRPTAVAAERIGRLKLNGRLTGYSPLSRVLELEGLTIGVAGKRSLWLNLRAAGVADRVRQVDLDRLLERADAQLARVEAQRAAAARIALGPRR